jgi:hypothetical protein
MRNYLVVILVVVMASPLLAEKWLTKNGGEYLGNSRSDPRFFVTCHGGVIVVGGARVRNTEDKCGSSIVGPITGSLKSFDRAERELVVNDSHGNEIAFHLTDEEAKILQGMSPGQSIRIEGTPGHRSIGPN